MKSKTSNLIPILLIYAFILLKHGTLGAKKQKYIYKQKDQWLEGLLKRTKRSLDPTHNHNRHAILLQQDRLQRPCPTNCNCNYDTVNCNDLIETCEECVHWSQIDFNQIVQMRPMSFKNFNFAPNRTTHIIIYKLLNSTIVENTFNSFKVKQNSQVQVTFQYNSMIIFDKHALDGLVIETNSTLIFNFPYTTQVVFLPKCFDGIQMKDQNSRLIIRILKSFSVRFVGDYNLHYQSLNMKDNLTLRKEPSHWDLSTGQLIFDIKLTHLVKFEEFSFSNLNLKSNARFYIDLELVEKLMIQRYAFSNLNLDSRTRMIFYSKQITFIDFRAFSFSSINLHNKSKLQIYLEELTSSLCLQRNVFSNMRFHFDSHTSRNIDDTNTFNFSVINSKNVQIMHDSFSNILIENPSSKLFIGVFNMPSYLLLFQNENYYKLFLTERLKYLSPSNSLNGINYNHQYSGHYVPNVLPINSEYYYNQQMENDLSSLTLTGRIIENEDHDSLNHYSNIKMDFKKFFSNNKQSYSYNFSIEKNCFSNLSLSFISGKNSNKHFSFLKNIWIIADNVHTLYLDNFVFNYTNSSLIDEKFNNINFVLNLKNFVLSKQTLSHVQKADVEFIREPRVFKFGILPRVIKIVGLSLHYSLINDTHDNLVLNNIDTNDEYIDSFDQENIDLIKLKYLANKRNSNAQTQRPRQVKIYGFCDLQSIASIINQDTAIQLDLRSSSNEIECSCQMIYFMLNQINHYANLDELNSKNILPCKLTDFNLIETCKRHLEDICPDEEKNDFVKFWEYCISEIDPQIKGHYIPNSNNFESQSNNLGSDTGNYLYNNFNDLDGIYSSSLSLSSSSFYEQSMETQLKPSLSSSASSESSSQANTSTNGLSNNIGKIVGIVIICSVLAIIFFMVAINIIQYKFRNDLLDDLEYSPNVLAKGEHKATNVNNQKLECIDEALIENSEENENENESESKARLKKKKAQSCGTNKVVDLDEIRCYSKYSIENEFESQEQNGSDGYYGYEDENELDEETEKSIMMSWK